MERSRVRPVSRDCRPRADEVRPAHAGRQGSDPCQRATLKGQTLKAEALILKAEGLILKAEGLTP
jgi:hypothetical protein